MRPLALTLLFAAATAAPAQFALQRSNTTASLRGIVNVNGNIAWASGTGGTVLKTGDGGTTWQTCAVPEGAAALDFRAIQAFDEKTALVMSSGPGDASRVFRTEDGCATWKQVFANPDAPNGFFDALLFTNRSEGWLLGDPVRGSFYLAATNDGGRSWKQATEPTLVADKDGGAFAASNASLVVGSTGPIFGGGAGTLYRGEAERCTDTMKYNDPDTCALALHFRRMPVEVGGSGAGAGIFALFRASGTIVAVGGDYTHPDNAAHIAAFSVNDGMGWVPAETQPRGYRSSVAYDPTTKTWIATGPTGTDISIDAGRNWKPLKPSPGDTPDADRNWNALSLPFVAGPKGRIGKLRPGALTKP